MKGRILKHMKFTVLALGCLLAVQPAVAQELAKAAEKQKKARRGDSKVYTEADIRGGPSSSRLAVPSGAAPATAAPAGQAGAAASGGAGEKSEDELRAEKKAEIEKKIQDARTRIADARKAIENAQLELNDVSNYTYGPRRAEIQKFIEDGQKEIAAQEQSIADLEEQARRAGIPIR